jgi:hypothetical protein
MIGRMKMSMEEAEEAYCYLLHQLFHSSIVTEKIRGLLDHEDAEADTAYNLVRKIRSLVNGKAEFDTYPIGKYLRSRHGDELLQDPALETSLSPCKV